MEGSQMQLEDWLDDLCVRFIINLPEEDLSSVPRICFQVEEAQWFYEDFIRPLDPSLPSMSLRTFCMRIFQHCPLLASFSADTHLQAFEDFLQYKTRVPVRGAILLNEEMDSTVLVKGWKKGASWSFPRGKINKDEDDLDCAIREVWEETGLDLRAAGLVPEGKPKYIEINMREQQMRLYVFRNIPLNTHFQPQTRKEISKIEWYRLSELPTFKKKGVQNANEAGESSAHKFYMVAPFLVPLKKWVVSQKKLEARKIPTTGGITSLPDLHYSVEEVPAERTSWGHEIGSTPAMDSYMGATDDLQRLLKQQPQSLGDQPRVAQDDRASALLSMLKSKEPVFRTDPQTATGLPHAPQELTGQQAPQPRNPSHHVHQGTTRVDAHDPPSHFSLDQIQSTTQWPGRPSISYQAQPQIAHRAPLVHPQPLPPQVQRAMFNQSTFQENLAIADALRNQRPSDAAASGATLFPSSVNLPNQSRILNDQTLALLNTFKKQTATSPSVQPVPTHDYLHGVNSIGNHPSDNKSAPMNDSSHLSELAGSSSQAIPAGQAQMAQAPDPHRSTLLDMFNRNQLPVTGPAVKHLHKEVEQPVRPIDAYVALNTMGSGMEKRLLDTLRHAPLSSAPGPTSPSEPSFTDTKDGAATLSQKPKSEHVAYVPEQSGHSHSAFPDSGVNQARISHPIRILQRSQHADSQSLYSATDKSPHSNGALNGAYGSPVNVTSIPSPGPSRRPDDSKDQKKQLLSLFGKQQQQQGPSSIDTTHGEVLRPRLASFASGSAEGSLSQGPPSRGATQTPISPADQTFLLDYLQSVTNKATVR